MFAETIFKNATHCLYSTITFMIQLRFDLFSMIQHNVCKTPWHHQQKKFWRSLFNESRAMCHVIQRVSRPRQPQTAVKIQDH